MSMKRERPPQDTIVEKKSEEDMDDGNIDEHDFDEEMKPQPIFNFIKEQTNKHLNRASK